MRKAGKCPTRSDLSPPLNVELSFSELSERTFQSITHFVDGNAI